MKPAVPRIALRQAGNTPVTSRTGLAKWMSGSRNPLFLRSAVNRLWQFHFGEPLAGTPNDIGRASEKPSHPELLDWLAAELPARDWSLKSMHRLLLTSATYQQVSRGAGKTWNRRLAADPDNQFYSRMNRRRLDGESLRDTLLAVGGWATQRTGGPGVRPPLPREITGTLLNNQWPVSTNREDHHRRSVYLFARRNLRYPLFDLFDRPDGTASCGRRKESTTAPQSLILLNSGFSLTMAKALAKRCKDGETPVGRSIRRMYGLLFQREPSREELHLAKRFLAEPSDGEVEPLTQFALALINLNEFLFVD